MLKTVFSVFALTVIPCVPGFAATAETAPVSATKNERLKVLNNRKVSPRTIKTADEAASPVDPQGSQPTEDQSGSNRASLLGLGISTLALSTAPTLSVIFQPGMEHQLQADLGIPSTNAFNLDINLGYRFGVAAFDHSGLHLGGFARLNLTANAVATVDLAFSPVAGIHLALSEDKRTLVSFDAGPTLTIAGGSVGFRFGALSSVLGLSIHRLF